MANTRVSDLNVGGAFASTDELYVVETAGVGGVKKTGTQLGEFVEDTTAGLTIGGTNITEVYDDGAGTLTFNLDADISLDSVTADFITFNTSPTITPAEGDLWYNSTDKCLNFQNDEADSTLQVGQENWVRVRNETGATITNGQAVYVSGAEAGGEGRLLVSLARADAANTSRVVGLATHDMENNTYGFISQFGLARDIDTSGFSAGAPIFLSETTAGALTDVEPTSPNISVFIGWAATSAVSGHVFITTIGNTSGDVLLSDAETVTANARKGSAGTINKGQAVYITGYNVGQNAVEVELARSDSASTMPALGIAGDAITNAANGPVVVAGQLQGVDTSGFAINDTLYVDPSTAGSLTTTKPVAANLIQGIARVQRVNASAGVIQVQGAGRTNDVPNFSAADKFWAAGTGGVTEEKDITAAGLALLDDADTDAQRTTLSVAEVLTADRSYFVSDTHGSDSNTGLSSESGTAQAGAATTITLAAGASAVDDFYNGSVVFIDSGTGLRQARTITDYNGTTKVATVATWTTNPDNTSVYSICEPFATIQKAVDITSGLLIGANNVTINVANDTYTENILLGPLPNGTAMIEGNISTLSDCIINGGSSDCVVATGTFGQWTVQGFRLNGTSFGIKGDAGVIIFDYIDFNNTGNHIDARNGGGVDKPASKNHDYTISAGAQHHVRAAGRSIINIGGATVTVGAGLTFSNSFARARFCSFISAGGITFSTTTATGKRYDVDGNGCINTGGGGANYFPGNSAGTTSPDDEYI